MIDLRPGLGELPVVLNDGQGKGRTGEERMNLPERGGISQNFQAWLATGGYLALEMAFEKPFDVEKVGLGYCRL